MPFDTEHNEPGGGGGDPHDPEKLEAIAQAMDQQIMLNVQSMGACFFHAYLHCAQHLLRSITVNLDLGAKDPSVTSEERENLENNEAEFAQMMQTAVKTFSEQLAQRRGPTQ